MTINNVQDMQRKDRADLTASDRHGNSVLAVVPRSNDGLSGRESRSAFLREIFLKDLLFFCCMANIKQKNLGGMLHCYVFRFLDCLKHWFL